jgi:hypothetical protein
MVLRFVVDVHTTCFGLHGHLQVCMIFHAFVACCYSMQFLIYLIYQDLSQIVINNNIQVGFYIVQGGGGEEGKKVIPVMACGGKQSCEMSRIPV